MIYIWVAPPMVFATIIEKQSASATGREFLPIARCGDQTRATMRCQADYDGTDVARCTILPIVRFPTIDLLTWKDPYSVGSLLGV